MFQRGTSYNSPSRKRSRKKIAAASETDKDKQQLLVY